MIRILIYETDRAQVRRYRNWFDSTYDMFYASSVKDTISLLSRYEIDILVLSTYGENISLEELRNIASTYRSGIQTICVSSETPKREITDTIIVSNIDALLYRPFSPSQFRYVAEKLYATTAALS